MVKSARNELDTSCPECGAEGVCTKHDGMMNESEFACLVCGTEWRFAHSGLASFCCRSGYNTIRQQQATLQEIQKEKIVWDELSNKPDEHSNKSPNRWREFRALVIDNCRNNGYDGFVPFLVSHSVLIAIGFVDHYLQQRHTLDVVNTFLKHTHGDPSTAARAHFKEVYDDFDAWVQERDG